jgi:PAS domain S-box-containing protein
LDSDGFMPQGDSFLWRPELLSLYVISDACIALTYYCIPLALLYFARKRRDLPLPGIMWLFSAFILLCGTSHLLSILVIWVPVYYAEAYVKAATGVASLATLGALIYYVPRVARMATQNVRLSEMVVKAEEHGRVILTAVVDNVFDGIITIGEDGLIKSFNATCSRLFGYAGEEVNGKEFKMLMPAQYHAEHDAVLREYLSTGISQVIGTGGREVAGLRKDGTIFPLDLSITSFTLDGTRYFTGCLRDVTAEKAALAEREDLLVRLTSSNAELERFAYVASHDMQEPVRMMLSFSQLLEQEYAGALDQEAQEYLRIISSSALRMRNMIRDLMDYARLDGERPNFSAVDLNQELEAVKQNLRQLISETGAEISSDPLPPVHGSAVQIMRLLQNLIINAIKYQPAGQAPCMHLAASQENLETVYSVQDNGVGIKPAFIDEIFQPFRRLHTWESIQGTGLGLSVCRKIVEGHGGRIWAESVPGEGTKISFTLS